MWITDPVKIVLFWALIGLFRPNFCCQGYRYVQCPTELNENEVSEYQSLIHSCKMIKQNIKVIGDHRLLVEDAAQTSITLYLEGVKSNASRYLLKELKRNGFQL